MGTITFVEDKNLTDEELALDRKAIHICTILNYLEEEINKKNAIKVANNLWGDQEKFDKAGMFFKLAFMTDNAVAEIAAKITG